MKKRRVFTIATAVVFVVAMVFSFVACGNNETEPTTTTETSTTTDAPTTTEKATTTTTTEPTTEETTEATTEETTAKPVTTTKKVNVDSEEDDEIFIGSPSGTMPYETTIKINRDEDLSKLGAETYGDIARAGKYYDENGNITTYDKIAEGEEYYYYDSYGDRQLLRKPYSKGNEPLQYYDYCIMCGYKLAGTEYYGSNNCPSCKKYIGYYTYGSGDYCENCGKFDGDINGESACMHGGCTSWIKDVTCICGEKVPAHTCHTCKK